MARETKEERAIREAEYKALEQAELLKRPQMMLALIEKATKLDISVYKEIPDDSLSVVSVKFIGDTINRELDVDGEMWEFYDLDSTLDLLTERRAQEEASLARAKVHWESLSADLQDDIKQNINYLFRGYK